MKIKLSVLILFCSLISPPAAYSSENFLNISDIGPSVTALDMDLDLGISVKTEETPLFIRARIGKFWMKGSNVLALGADFGSFGNYGLGGGIEGEWLSISTGLWFQGKLLSSKKENLITGLGLGWSLLGMEALIAPLKGNNVTVLAKVRLPIGLLSQ